MNGNSTIMEIVTHVAACTFNEGSFALLDFMQDIQIGSGAKSREWARTVDDLQISRAEEKVAHDRENERILHRQIQKDT